jgi:hypothetical protein
MRGHYGTVSLRDHFPHVLDIAALAALAARMETTTDS